MQIATFKATCADCKKSFSYPDLGEFVYGEFIFTGQNGKCYAHYSAVGNPISEKIKSIISKSNKDTTDIFQEAVAFFADPIEGQKLTNKQLCPHCLSTNWETWGETQTGSIEVQEATFRSFKLLTKIEKVNKIKRLIA